MNGVCGIVSFNLKTDFEFLKATKEKMEEFSEKGALNMDIGQKVTLSVREGSYFEYIGEYAHFLCIVAGNPFKELHHKENPCRSVARLFLKFGRAFTEFLSGEYIIFTYDFIKNDFSVFQDQMSSIPIFYTLHNKTLYFSTNIQSLFEVPGNRKTFSVNSVNKLLTLYPALKHGETIYDNINFIPYGYSLSFSDNGINIKKCRHREMNFHHHTLKRYKLATTCNPYCIADLKLSPSYGTNPFVLESARKKRKFTNKMLLDIFYINNRSFSFEIPFFNDIEKSCILHLIRPETKEKLSFYDYRSNSFYDEISNMPYFSYNHCKDIELHEIIFLNDRMLLTQIICDIFSFLSHFNIKDESILSYPGAVSHIISMSRQSPTEKVLSEMFMTDIVFEDQGNFPGLFCAKLKNLCRFSHLKIFDIFDRYKIYEKALSLNPHLALYILQINYILEKKNVSLEF